MNVGAMKISVRESRPSRLDPPIVLFRVLSRQLCLPQNQLRRTPGKIGRGPVVGQFEVRAASFASNSLLTPRRKR